MAYLSPEKPAAYISIQHGGFSEERFARLLQASDHPDMKELMAPFVLEVMSRRSHVTRLRQEIDAEGRFPSSAVYPLWLAADIAPIVLSAQPLNHECVSLIAIYRSADQPLFN